MASESVVDQIVKSLSFEVEALPQEDAPRLTGTSTSTPLNVKIRVRKKGESGIEQGFLSVPKFGCPDAIPERIRLISSDQTIMSFDVAMDANFAKKPKRKTRKLFFGSCLGTEGDDDEVPYTPSPTYIAKIDDMSPSSKSEDVIRQNFTLSKLKYNNNDTVKQYTKKHGILGKCKPGGCLDPPFSEEKYSYEPIKKGKDKKKRYSKQDITKPAKNKLTKPINGHNFTKESESPSKNLENKQKVKTDENQTRVLSIYDNPSKDSIVSKYSDSVITYPPLTSSSTFSDERNSKNRVSSEEKPRKSYDDSVEAFFSSPKRNSQNNEKTSKEMEETTKDKNKNIIPIPLPTSVPTRFDIKVEKSQNPAPTITDSLTESDLESNPVMLKRKTKVNDDKPLYSRSRVDDSPKHPTKTDNLIILSSQDPTNISKTEIRTPKELDDLSEPILEMSFDRDIKDNKDKNTILFNRDPPNDNNFILDRTLQTKIDEEKKTAATKDLPKEVVDQAKKPGANITTNFKPEFRSGEGEKGSIGKKSYHDKTFSDDDLKKTITNNGKAAKNKLKHSVNDTKVNKQEQPESLSKTVSPDKRIKSTLPDQSMTSYQKYTEQGKNGVHFPNKRSTVPNMKTSTKESSRIKGRSFNGEVSSDATINSFPDQFIGTNEKLLENNINKKKNTEKTDFNKYSNARIQFLPSHDVEDEQKSNEDLLKDENNVTNKVFDEPHMASTKYGDLSQPLAAENSKSNIEKSDDIRSVIPKRTLSQPKHEQLPKTDFQDNDVQKQPTELTQDTQNANGHKPPDKSASVYDSKTSKLMKPNEVKKDRQHELFDKHDSVQKIIKSERFDRSNATYKTNQEEPVSKSVAITKGESHDKPNEVKKNIETKLSYTCKPDSVQDTKQSGQYDKTSAIENNKLDAVQKSGKIEPYNKPIVVPNPNEDKLYDKPDGIQNIESEKLYDESDATQKTWKSQRYIDKPDAVEKIGSDVSLDKPHTVKQIKEGEWYDTVDLSPKLNGDKPFHKFSASKEFKHGKSFESSDADKKMGNSESFHKPFVSRKKNSKDDRSEKPREIKGDAHDKPDLIHKTTRDKLIDEPAAVDYISKDGSFVNSRAVRKTKEDELVDESIADQKTMKGKPFNKPSLKDGTDNDELMKSIAFQETREGVSSHKPSSDQNTKLGPFDSENTIEITSDNVIFDKHIANQDPKEGERSDKFFGIQQTKEGKIFSEAIAVRKNRVIDPFDKSTGNQETDSNNTFDKPIVIQTRKDSIAVHETYENKPVENFTTLGYRESKPLENLISNQKTTAGKPFDKPFALDERSRKLSFEKPIGVQETRESDINDKFIPIQEGKPYGEAIETDNRNDVSFDKLSVLQETRKSDTFDKFIPMQEAREGDPYGEDIRTHDKKDKSFDKPSVLQETRKSDTLDKFIQIQEAREGDPYGENIRTDDRKDISFDKHSASQETRESDTFDKFIPIQEAREGDPYDEAIRTDDRKDKSFDKAWATQKSRKGKHNAIQETSEDDLLTIKKLNGNNNLPIDKSQSPTAWQSKPIPNGSPLKLERGSRSSIKSSKIRLKHNLGALDRQSVASSKSSLKKDLISLDLVFQSYVNDKKERIVKSIDNSADAVRYPDDTITVVQSQLRPDVNEIRIPVDSENDLMIQIHRTKSPQRVQIKERDSFDFVKSPGKSKSYILREMTNLSNFDSYSQENFLENEIPLILNSVYEQELVPLHKTINHLKDEIDSLANQQSTIIESLMTARRTKPIRLLRVNSRCACSRR